MQPLNVPVVVVEDFGPFRFLVPCIIFGDKVATKKRFEAQLCAEQPDVAPLQNSLSIYTTYSYGAVGAINIVVIPRQGITAHRPPQSLPDALDRARQSGAQIVELCLSVLVLDYAGLLGDKRAATYWEPEQDFQARFPAAYPDVSALYVDDNNIITSAGTAAVLDCCLYVTRQRFGSAVVDQVVRRIVMPPHREGGQAQFIEQPAAKSAKDQRINVLLDYLHQHLHEPHNLDKLARRVVTSRRTLTRRLMRAAGLGVAGRLIAERLRRD